MHIVTAMFAVISRCVAHSLIFISIITAEDAVIIEPWYNTDSEGDNVIMLRSVPTMMFTMATILRFSDFAWVRANIRAIRIPATRWDYGEGARMLPPTSTDTTTRSCEVTLTTAPTYKCTGYTRYSTPVLIREEGPAHPRSVNIIGDIFLIASIRRQRRTRQIQVQIQEFEPVIAEAQSDEEEDAADQTN